MQQQPQQQQQQQQPISLQQQQQQQHYQQPLTQNQQQHLLQQPVVPYNGGVMNPSAYMNLTPNGMQHVLANGVGNTGPLLQQQSPQPAWVGLYNEQKKNEEAAVNYEKPSAVESQSEDVLTFNTKLCESLFTDELRMDFDDFKRMTLIDDYEILDNLYSYSGQFNNSKIAASTIISLYRNKYKDLFERYPSLSSYILFVVIVIIENSYTGFLNIFKNLKTENRLAIKPKTIRDSKFSLVYRKRKLDATDSSSSDRDNETHNNANTEINARPITNKVFVGSATNGPTLLVVYSVDEFRLAIVFKLICG